MSDANANQAARSKRTKWLYAVGIVVVLLLIATIPLARAKAKNGA